MQVIVMRGLSGSGKSDYVKRHFPKAVVVSADNYFMVDGEYRFDVTKMQDAHNACWRGFYAAVQARAELIVVDNINAALAEVGPYFLPAKAHGYAVKVITILCDPEVALDRNTHGTSPEVMHMFHDQLMKNNELIPRYWTHEFVENS